MQVLNRTSLILIIIYCEPRVIIIASPGVYDCKPLQLPHVVAVEQREKEADIE